MTSTKTIRRIAGALRSASQKRKWFSTAWECESYFQLDSTTAYPREFGAGDWHEMGRLLEAEAGWLDFLSTRDVPPRCLNCAGHNIQEMAVVDEDGERGWVHPICGGTFRSKVVGRISLSPPDKKIIYRPDGLFLHVEPYEPTPLFLLSSLD